MSSERTPLSPPPRRETGSFRSQAAGSKPANRIDVIWAGNEKLATEATVNATMRGLAVMFSPTSDGGALAVHAWFGTRHWKDYCTSPEELQEVLEGLSAFKPAQPGPAPISPLKSRR